MREEKGRRWIDGKRRRTTAREGVGEGEREGDMRLGLTPPPN